MGGGVEGNTFFFSLWGKVNVIKKHGDSSANKLFFFNIPKFFSLVP